MEDPSNSIKNKSISYKITNSDSQIFNIIFSLIENKLEILINEKSIISSCYKAVLELENFIEINKFFRQFDSIEELFEFLMSLENPEEKIKITSENKFAVLEIYLPSFSKSKENHIKLEIPQIELKGNDLISKLCEKIKKIDLLEEKINFLFYCTGKTEKDFILFNEYMGKFDKNLEKSKIVAPEDFHLISEGIKQKLNKVIIRIKLLYRASRDGDNNQFHIKCDGKKNTVTFVKTLNNRRFGGFANKEWSSNDTSVNDPNAFLFSLDNNECYYLNYNINSNEKEARRKRKKRRGFTKVIHNNSFSIYNSNNYYNNYNYSDNYLNNSSKNCSNYDSLYCSGSNGPIWGNSNYKDLFIANGCLSNKNSFSNQKLYDYNGRVNALSIESNFRIEDYETYELILEKNKYSFKIIFYIKINFFLLK